MSYIIRTVKQQQRQAKAIHVLHCHNEQHKAKNNIQGTHPRAPGLQTGNAQLRSKKHLKLFGVKPELFSRICTIVSSRDSQVLHTLQNQSQFPQQT